MDADRGFTRGDLNRFLILLVLCELVLVATYLIHIALGSPTSTLTRLFNIDGEASIPAWFSSTQLFVIGALFLLRSAFRRPQVDPPRWFIVLAGAAFVFLSMDEALYFHETIARVLRESEVMPPLTANGLPTWILLYPAVGVPVLLLSLRSIMRMCSKHRAACAFIALGALTFVTGAAGFEVIAYEIVVPADGALYPLSVAVEEFLEMLGASLVLYGTGLFALPVRRQEASDPSVSYHQDAGDPPQQDNTTSTGENDGWRAAAGAD
jgi:hypothetical protein